MDAIEISKQIVFGGADNILLHNNANKASERIPVMKNMIAGEVIKQVSREMLPKEVTDGHDSGDIHFHDLDESIMLPFYNCCLVNLKDMLDNGCVIGNAEIETPKSIATASAVTAQIIAQVACHQYGGVSINRIDEILAPYVTKSYHKHLAIGHEYCDSNDKAVAYATKMTHKEVDAACQSMEYEINTLFTSQGQTPFVTFGFGLGTSWQAKSIQRGILQQRINGLGKQKRTAIFPKLVYMVDEGVNSKAGEQNYHDIRKLALDCAAKRNYPDILNMPSLRKSGGGCTPMGCRAFLPEWENPETGELEWDGRCNLGVISVNVPRIAIRANGCIDTFWDILTEQLHVAKIGLDARIDRLRNVKADVAPILYQSGAIGRLKADDNIFQLFENKRSSISLGYIGLHEAAEAMKIDDLAPHKSIAKQEFMQEIVARLRAATKRWTENADIYFGLYSTPSESLCDRFCRLDQKEFGIIEGVTDRDYYTNSFHLDVREKVSPFVKFMFEQPYHKHASAGHISYAEIPNVEHGYRVMMLDELWKYAYKIGLPYQGQNCAIDKCHAENCHWEGDAQATEDGFVCGSCGNSNPSSMEITKRVCGYLGNTNARPFNWGKQQEVIRRVKHTTADDQPQPDYIK